MGNAIYHKSSKGRPAYIVKDGERLATFLHQPTYDNGVRMAWALSDQMGVSTPVLNQPVTLEHGDPQPVRGDFDNFAHGLIGRHMLVTVRNDQDLRRSNPEDETQLHVKSCWTSNLERAGEFDMTCPSGKSRPGYKCICPDHNPRSLSHNRHPSPYAGKVVGPLGDDEFYTAQNVQL